MAHNIRVDQNMAERFNELPALLWDDQREDPDTTEEHWSISCTAQVVKTFQDAQPMNGTVWLPLSRELQRAAEVFTQLVCGSAATSREPQMLRLTYGWRFAVFWTEEGEAKTIAFKRVGDRLLQVHEITKAPLTWSVPLAVRTTMNRMSD